MKKIVLTFGLIAGLITAGTLLTMLLVGAGSQGTVEHGEIIGYTSMLIAFILVYFGIRAYRDQNGGSVSFSRAFKVGFLITLVASTVYVATWQVYYYNFGQDFIEKYSANQLEKQRAAGASEIELAAQQAKMQEFAILYKNPLVNVGLSYLEIIPVGLLVTLVSAAVLKRRSMSEPVAA